MLVSKREFSKLSRRDQQILQKNANPTSKKTTKRPKNKTIKPTPGQRLGRQASVAAAYSTPAIGRSPNIKATRDSCNIKHCELIGNVTGSVAFTVQQNLAVNPGIAATFPWLSVMAQAWEEYRFRSIRFVYKTRTGSTTVGSVMIAPDYDAADAAPNTEQIMSTYAQVIEDAPWKDITCVLKTSNENPLGKRHYIRSGALAANLDIKTYDIANVYVATVDASGAVAFGKLWVEYDVDFFIPQLPSAGAVIALGGSVASGGSESGANPLGTTPVIHANASGFTVSAASVITFLRVGYYTVAIYFIGTTISAPVWTYGAGGTEINSASAVKSDGTDVVIYSTVHITTLVAATLTLSCTAVAITSGEVSIGSAPDSSLG